MLAACTQQAAAIVTTETLLPLVCNSQRGRGEMLFALAEPARQSHSGITKYIQRGQQQYTT